jgi:hypothetical protein
MQLKISLLLYMPVKRSSKRSSKCSSKQVRRISKKVHRSSHKGSSKKVRKTSKKVRKTSKRNQKGGKNGKLLLKIANSANNLLLTRPDFDFANNILKNKRTIRPPQNVLEAANVLLALDKDMVDLDEKVVSDSDINAISSLIAYKNLLSFDYS